MLLILVFIVNLLQCWPAGLNIAERILRSLENVSRSGVFTV